MHENLKGIYGKIMSICEDNLHERLYRLPDFAEVRQQKDAVELWNMISSIVCDDGAAGDLEERRFRALNRYNTNQMGPTEILLTFYKRFKLLNENRNILVSRENECRITENGRVASPLTNLKSIVE